MRSSGAEGVVWNFCETLWNVSSWRGGQGSGAKARNAMDHPPARDLMAALLHFVSHRASFASFGGGSAFEPGEGRGKAQTTVHFLLAVVSSRWWSGASGARWERHLPHGWVWLRVG